MLAIRSTRTTSHPIRDMKRIFEKSIVTALPLEGGHAFEREHLAFKKPGDGISGRPLAGTHRPSTACAISRPIISLPSTTSTERNRRDPKKRICTVIGSRANYSAHQIGDAGHQADTPSSSCSSSCVASAVLDRYGHVVDLIERDGFSPVAAKLHMLVEGETPATMAKSTGLGLIELPRRFDQMRPDVVHHRRRPLRDHGDDARRRLHEYPGCAHHGRRGFRHHRREHPPRRHQVRAHPFPGEPRCARAHHQARRATRARVPGRLPAHRSRGRDSCCRQRIRSAPTSSTEASAPRSSLDEPFLLVSQHPVTTEYGEGEDQITATLEAVRRLGPPGHRAVAQRGRGLGGHLRAASANGANMGAAGKCTSSRTCRSTSTCG